MKGGAGPAAQGAHQPAGRVQRRLRAASPAAAATAAPDARQAAGRPRLRATTRACKQNSRLSGADKQLVDQLRDAGVRAAGEADAQRTPMMSCTPPVTPASMANNTGLNATDITTQVEPVPRRRRGGADVRSHARHHHRRAQGAGARPRLGQHDAGRPLPLGGRERRHLARPGARLVERELAPDAEGDQRLDRQRGVREAARASWTSPRWAAPPTSTTRSSTGATSSASTTSRTACPACSPAARAASSSPAATSTTSTGTAAPTSPRRTATSSRASRTTSSW